MPFTLSHAAAALLFRRTRLVLSAVVVGCCAPDFVYFLEFGRTADSATPPRVCLYSIFLLVSLCSGSSTSTPSSRWRPYCPIAPGDASILPLELSQLPRFRSLPLSPYPSSWMRARTSFGMHLPTGIPGALLIGRFSEGKYSFLCSAFGPGAIFFNTSVPYSGLS
jgi:hypothetical protein